MRRSIHSAAAPTVTAAHATVLDGAPDWVHLIPAGSFQGRDGRGPYVLRDAGAVIAATRALGMDVVIDRDHQTDFAPKGTPVKAAGWIKDLERRADGLWGRVEWTEAAAAEIAAREYRYLSPVFEYRRGSGEVMRLVRASLTNNPNLHLTAINSQGDSGMEELLQQLRATFGLGDDADQAAVVSHARQLAERDRSHGAQVSAIATALNLADTATAEAIAAHARELVARGDGDPDPSRFVPMSQFSELSRQLEDLQKRLAGEDAEKAVEAAMREGKVSPGLRDWAIAYAGKDLDGFRAWAKAAPAIVKPGLDAHARTAPPSTREMDDEDVAICAQLGIAPEDFKKSLQEAR